jgi:hypothetical protein
MTLVKKVREAIEVGQRRRRPFERHRLSQRRKSGVPQVSSQRTTLS